MWQYRAALVRVIDGDTLVMNLDLGFHVRTEQHIRLLNVSAPEMGTPGGVESHAFVQAWTDEGVTRAWPSVWPFVVGTETATGVDAEARRSRTRYMGRVWWHGMGAPSLNYELDRYLAKHPEWGTGR